MVQFENLNYAEKTPGCQRCAHIEEKQSIGQAFSNNTNAGFTKRKDRSSRNLVRKGNSTDLGFPVNSAYEAHQLLRQMFKYPLVLLRYTGIPMTLFRSTGDVWDCEIRAEEGSDWNIVSHWRAAQKDSVSFAILFMFCTLVHCLSVVRCLAFILYASFEYDLSTTFYYVHFTLFTLPGSFVFASDVLRTPRHYTKLSEEAVGYVGRFGLLCDPEKFQRKVKIWTCFVVFVFASMIISWAVYYQNWYPRNPFYIYPWLDCSDTEAYVLGCIVGSAMMITMWPYIVHYILYTFLVSLLIGEFSQTKEELEDALDDEDGEDLQESVTSVRERHVALSRIVSDLSDQTHFFSGLVIVFDQVMIMLVVYAMARGPFKKDRVVSEMMSCVFSTLSIVCVCGYWGKLNDVAHSISVPLCFASWNGKDRGTLQKIQLFISGLSCAKIGIDVFGIYIIDSGTLIMILGTLATYGVVILEFEKGGDGPACPLPVANITANV